MSPFIASLSRLVFCFVLLLPVLAFAQEKPGLLEAVVVNEDGIPVDGANIRSGNILAPIGTATDQKGSFQLSPEQWPTQLIISHLNYETETINLENAEALADTIVLKELILSLPDITVRAKSRLDTVYRQPYSVTDYAFYRDRVILLACKSSIKGFSLILLDQENRELDDYSLRHLRPKNLYQSCGGRLYLITSNSVREILITDDRIGFGERISRGDFSDGLENCVLANDSMAYFQRYYYQGQALQYFILNREELKKAEEEKQFPLIEDERNIVLLIEETGCRLPWSGDVWEENVTDKLERLRESSYGLAGMMKIFYPKIYAPLYPKDSLLCIFNHTGAQLQYFTTAGNLVQALAIDYHRYKKWSKRIYYDAYHQEAYTSFRSDEGEAVYAIDMNTGQLGAATSIPMHFIENIKVWNGHLYYLYRNRGNKERNRMLHRIQVR